jgi:hypothetical protein
MKTLVVGELLFAVEHRSGDKGGPSLHMIVRMPPDPPHQETRRFQQVWRADCFKVKPHEHLFGSREEVIRDLPYQDAGHLVDWCLTRLTNPNDIVRAAGYKAPEVLLKPLSAHHAATLRQWMCEA